MGSDEPSPAEVARAAHHLLDKAQAVSESHEADLPHIVVTFDEELGTTTYSGPYPTPQEALTAAERNDRQLNADLSPDEPGWRSTVAPIYPPGPTTRPRTAERPR